jgi:alpha-soluble NSF attachment protein
MSDAREALALLAKADKKATSSTFWFGSNKYEDAAELYTKAANSFKLAKRCMCNFHFIACYFVI